MVRAIPLTEGKIALVDDEDYPKLTHLNWFAQKMGKSWYARCKIRIDGKRKFFYMHRLVVNASPIQMIDHANHNGLDNRRSNLRFCSRSQNKQNSLKQGFWGGNPTSSSFKGVVWDRTYHKWGVWIRANGRNNFVGYFKTELEAAEAYDRAASHFFGEYALTNF